MNFLKIHYHTFLLALSLMLIKNITKVLMKIGIFGIHHTNTGSDGDRTE